MKQKALLITAVLSLVWLAGCNTMEGFGKDVQKVGGKIEQKADEKK